MSFPRSHMIFAKGFTSETHPRGPQSFTDDEWIEAFYSKYSFWILRVAENLLEGDPASGFQKDPDSGFAVLLILFPYFEMIARHRAGKDLPSDEGFNRGMTQVFQRDPIFIVEQGQAGIPVEFDISSEITKKVLEYLRYNLRNELAHVAFTGKGIVISGGYPGPIIVRVNEDDDVMAVGVNPHLWVKRIREDFETYANTLRNPENTTERENFLLYARRYVSPAS